ncbi:hypothetical protein EZ313_02540 [Ramlibacter henchirensis]|uniref:Glycoside hydrolase family 16 protein n=1 Tax=Ramlibacter henchirensis TaxID=204072 RepID=A0A4Z0C1S4_9BURK|nr:hypothetical protein [Ramlibacter henchirensis]TFZ05567.1 hypothetical protein EZ313_02540 [Ramlibacter henchirensis]
MTRQILFRAGPVAALAILAACGGGGGGALDSGSTTTGVQVAQSETVLAGSTRTEPPEIPVAASSNAWLQVGNPDDAYWMEDNRWGQSGITEGPNAHQFEQQIGVSPNVGPNGEVAFRMKWRWPNPPGSAEVKGFPSVLNGRRPGYYSTGTTVDGDPVRLPNGSTLQQAPTGHTPGTLFPMQLPVKSLKAKFNFAHLSAPTGQGQLTFDIWLQSGAKQDTGFLNSSITHEIMVPLSHWGNYGAHNVPDGRKPHWFDHTATIGGKEYHVYATKSAADGCLRYDFMNLNGSYGRTGWKMIAFVPAVLPADPGEIDLAAIINYVATRADSCGEKWAVGNEHVASVELGVEPVAGAGDITVYDYKVWGAK